MPEIQVDWHSRQEADRLRDLRDRHGMVWRGVLLEGAKHAESMDLLKALTELHPALTTALPGPTGNSEDVNEGLSRSDLVKELREQIHERQCIRATTEVPPSAFDGEMDANTQRQCEIERDHILESEGMEAQQSRINADRARAYKQWDVQEARTVDEGGVPHLDPHADVQDVLRHEGRENDHPDNNLDEWEVYDDSLYDYDGEY